MNATLKISSRGTVTLPGNFRKRFLLKTNDILIIKATDEGILLKPAAVYPTEIYSSERLSEFEKNNNQAIKSYFPDRLRHGKQA